MVIPHYDNAEGGTHDTRFCYMGERRLAVMEAMLPDDAWVLGVDEHTAVIVTDARTVSVTGRGALTVRRRGESRRFAAGEQLDARHAAGPRAGRDRRAQAHRRAERRRRRRPGGTGRRLCAQEALATARGGQSPRAGVRQRAGRAKSGRRGRGDPGPPRPHDPGVGGRQPAVGRARSRARHPALAGGAPRRGGGGRRPRPARASGAARRRSLIHAAQRSCARRKRGSWPIGVRDRLTAAHIEVRDTPTGTEWDLREIVFP